METINGIMAMMVNGYVQTLDDEDDWYVSINGNQYRFSHTNMTDQSIEFWVTYDGKWEPDLEEGLNECVSLAYIERMFKMMKGMIITGVTMHLGDYHGEED